MADSIKLHKVVPEDLYRVAQIIDILRNKYGPKKAASMLHKVAHALETGKFPNGGKEREIFVSNIGGI